MSNSNTLRPSSSWGEAHLRAAVAGLVAAIRGTHQRWLQERRLHACNVAIRQLDRRTRRDLGLYVDGDTDPHDRSLLAAYERMRW